MTTSKITNIIRTAFLGGIVILLPLAIIAFFAKWIIQTTATLIEPFANVVIHFLSLPVVVADVIAISLLFFFCVFIGTAVKTKVGHWLYNALDGYLLGKVPGYKTVKEVITQVLGGSSESSLMKGEVARAQIFGPQSPTTVTGLVTSRNTDGTVTLFVPTGPNPTSGQIFHVPTSLVTLYPDANVEKMMRTVIGCGSGSHELFNNPATSPGK